jgi:hypothetical protein
MNTLAVKIESFTDSFLNNVESLLNNIYYNKKLKNKTKGIDYITKDYEYMKCQGYPPIMLSNTNSRYVKNRNPVSMTEVDLETLDVNINKV